MCKLELESAEPGPFWEKLAAGSSDIARTAESVLECIVSKAISLLLKASVKMAIQSLVEFFAPTR